MFFPKNIRINANGLTNILVHTPSYLPLVGLKSSHLGNLSILDIFPIAFSRTNR